MPRAWAIRCDPPRGPHPDRLRRPSPCSRSPALRHRRRGRRPSRSHRRRAPPGVPFAPRRGPCAGCRLRLEHVDAAGFHLTVEGRSVAIDPVAALNLTVEPVGESAAEDGLERLDALRPGEEGVVVALGAQLQGAQRRRLLDLGVVPGTVITAEFASPSGDPMAYRIRGALIALRRAHADGSWCAGRRRRRPREPSALHLACAGCSPKGTARRRARAAPRRCRRAGTTWWRSPAIRTPARAPSSTR